MSVSAASKGFGKGAQGPMKDGQGCPCGSNKFYKECCKRYHQGTAPPPSLDATIRARFSAVVKKEVPFLMSTFHPDFHAYQYSTAPGEATEQLRNDMERTVSDFVYSNLRILKIENGDRPNEQYAEFQYTVFDKRSPDLDGNGDKRRLVRMEKSRFLQGDDGVWRFVDYQMADVPEALVKAKDKQLADADKEKAEAEEGSSAPGAVLAA